jgi:hypothetical protein
MQAPSGTGVIPLIKQKKFRNISPKAYLTVPCGFGTISISSPHISNAHCHSKLERKQQKHDNTSKYQKGRECCNSKWWLFWTHVNMNSSIPLQVCYTFLSYTL